MFHPSHLLQTQWHRSKNLPSRLLRRKQQLQMAVLLSYHNRSQRWEQPGTPNTPVPTAIVPSTPTNVGAVVTTAVVVSTPSGPTTTPLPPGVRPATYVLQYGEFPYCIARRFNVDPDALLSASGLTSPDVYSVGDVLTIPQSGAFPGSRALATHPTTYTVVSGDETVYSVACKFGDVDPSAIASANGISVSAKLTAGQALKIP